MHSLGFHFSAILSLLVGLAIALPYDADIIKGPMNKAVRSADTCADPSLTQPVLEAFDATGTMHALAFRFAFETDNTETGAATWTDIHPLFNAWPTQQNFTAPLFRLETPAQTEFAYVIGTDAQMPPVVSGFTAHVAVVAWVYATQVCGSVPLMSAKFPAATDSYYTINPFVHAGLITDGWVDNGVVAFVLPPGTD